MRILCAALFTLSTLASLGCEKSAELAIQSASPNRGVIAGGTSVVLTGSGFQGQAQGVQIYFGKNNRGKNVIIHSDSKMVVDAPSGNDGEAVDIEIIFDDSRSAKLTKAFTYYNPNPSPGAPTAPPTTP